MDNSNTKESGNSVIPLLVGAAAGAALAYIFASSSSTEDGAKLKDTLSQGWETLKEKFPFIEDEVNSFKSKIMDTVKSNLKPDADHIIEE